eukprot:TRINITY_DN888_c0_g2_i1.p1 TRINITY_DN888_c0_g2~~TRINITY_DN888_c0_g2_i1.p1  ORF type:complete len:951 (+),score=136.72 TRINITY_DN888_c0_g2_i1:89-2854(+)
MERKEIEDECHRRKLLTPLFGILWILLLVETVVHVGRQKWLKAGLWLAVVIGYMVPLYHSGKRGKLGMLMTEICLVATGMALGMLHDAVSLGKNENWIFLFISMQCLFLIKARSATLVVFFVVSLMYVILRTLEDIKRYGLYDIFPNENVYDPPKPLGWSEGLPLLMRRAFLVFVFFTVSYRSMQICKAQERCHVEATQFAEKMADSLGRLDLEAAKETLQEFTSQHSIVEPFTTLHKRLRVYRRYLPETFFLSDGKALDMEPLDKNVADIVVEIDGVCSDSDGDDTLDDQDVTWSAAIDSNIGNTTNPLEVPTPETAPLQTYLEIGVREIRVSLMVAEVDLRNISSMKSAFGVSNRFASNIMQFVRAEKGVVLDIRADSVVSSWNSHQRCPQHAVRACNAALRARTKWSAALTFIGMHWWGISLTSGQSVVGQIGDDRHCAPVVKGPAYIQALHIGSLAKQLNCRIVATQCVKELADTWMYFKPIDIIPADIRNPNFKDTIMLYQIVGEAKSLQKSEARLAEMYASAFMHVKNGEYIDAAAGFHQVASESDDEQAIRFYELLTENPSLVKPYVRLPIGWEDFGCTNNLASLKKSIFESSMLTQQESANSEIGLEAELRRRMEGIKDPVDVDDGEYTDEPPKTFTDRIGHSWRRSNKVLGTGGKGEVWEVLGEDGGLSAVKTVNSLSWETRQNRIEGILKEVGLLSTLQHQNVVSYISSCVIGGFVLTVMELVPGGSLLSVVERFGALPTSSTRRYARDILHGLEYLHNLGIVHRDLKLANVLLDTDGQCKLADFGAAAEFSAVIPGSKDGDNTVVGTPPYIAPEACRCEVVKESDIWSLGICLIHLLTAVLPYKTQTGMLYMYKFVHNLALEHPDYLPTIPAGIEPIPMAFIKSCLKTDSSERPSASALLSSSFIAFNRG